MYLKLSILMYLKLSILMYLKLRILMYLKLSILMFLKFSTNFSPVHLWFTTGIGYINSDVHGSSCSD